MVKPWTTMMNYDPVISLKIHLYSYITILIGKFPALNRRPWEIEKPLNIALHCRFLDLPNQSLPLLLLLLLSYNPWNLAKNIVKKCTHKNPWDFKGNTPQNSLYQKDTYEVFYFVDALELPVFLSEVMVSLKTNHNFIGTLINITKQCMST